MSRHPSRLVRRQPPPPAAVPHPVPPAVRASAAWSWRLLVIAAGLALLAWLVVQLRIVVFPVVAALLVAAGLQPLVGRARRLGLGRGPAAAVVLVAFLVVVLGGLGLIGRQVGVNAGEVWERAGAGLEEIRTWLADGPLGIDDAQLDRYADQALTTIQDNQGRLTSGAVSTATLAFEFLTGTVLALFTLVFFLYDGRRIWAWTLRLFPSRSRAAAARAGERAWLTLTGYVRGTVIIALVDAVFITVVLLVLQVPLAVPLGALVFFGAFVPIVGAFVTGSLAVLVALVSNGLVPALVVLAGIVAIQQIEGHLLQPFLLGRMVAVHPLAVVLAVATGVLVGGIPGAIVAVPLVAVTNSAGLYLAGRSRGEVAVTAAPPR